MIADTLPRKHGRMTISRSIFSRSAGRKWIDEFAPLGRRDAQDILVHAGTVDERAVGVETNVPGGTVPPLTTLLQVDPVFALRASPWQAGRSAHDDA